MDFSDIIPGVVWMTFSSFSSDSVSLSEKSDGLESTSATSLLCSSFGFTINPVKSASSNSGFAKMEGTISSRIRRSASFVNSDLIRYRAMINNFDKSSRLISIGAKEAKSKTSPLVSESVNLLIAALLSVLISFSDTLCQFFLEMICLKMGRTSSSLIFGPFALNTIIIIPKIPRQTAFFSFPFSSTMS